MSRERPEPDSTAVRTALWRALHLEIDAPPHVFEDDVGLKLAAPGEGWQCRPDMSAFTRPFRASILARARFVEDLVENQAARGVDQYVILGAGLDTFVQRRPEIASRLMVFEIDRANPQAWKRERLADLGFGVPSFLRFVPVDFERGEPWSERLRSEGFDPRRRWLPGCPARVGRGARPTLLRRPRRRPSEFAGSGRQSRIAMLAEGELGTATIGGYYEGDFLSAEATSNSNESNSYTFRQRQFWAQAAFENGTTITGGQMWSLVTETAHGVEPRSEALPMTIDSQYHVGFSWARQFGFRVARNVHDGFWLAAAVENPQTTFASHGQTSNFLLGAPGNGGGLYNPGANYSFNVAPDVIGKAAFEPVAGQHYEVCGISSSFRDRVFPDAGAPYNVHTMGGGVGVNARATLGTRLTAGLHYLTGRGIGRYGTTGLPDATVHADGTLALITSQQVLGTLQVHLARFDLAFNGGAEYAGREAEATGAGTAVGYGSPLFANGGCWTEPNPGAGGYAPGTLTACTADTRRIVEETGTLWYTFSSGPKGAMKLGVQISRVTRSTWAGTGSPAHPDGAPRADDMMLFTSLRSYLP